MSDPVLRTVRRVLTPPWLRTAVMVLVPVAGILAVASRVGHTYFFYDEWGYIGRAVNGNANVANALASFNGHLVLFPYLAYAAQVRWFGLAGHIPILVVFCASLVLLQGGVAAVLVSLGVRVELAVLAAGLVTYFGPGSQSMVFEVQLSWNLATGLGLLAAAFILRSPPTRIGVCLSSLLLLFALGCDSGLALVAATFCGAAGAIRWRRPSAVLPAAVFLAPFLAWWVLVGHRGQPPSPPQSAGAVAHFVVNLLGLSIGGLLGGGRLVGAAAAVPAAVLLVHALRRGRDRRVTAGIVGAAGSLGVSTVTLAASRAGIVGSDFPDYNRYLQLSAIYLMLMLLPAVARLVSTAGAPVRGRVEAAVGVVVVVVFLVNLGPLVSYRRTFETWNTQTRVQLSEVVYVLDHGCADLTTPTGTSPPLGSLDPQISLALVQRLRSQGVSLPRPQPPISRIVGAVCSG